MDANEVKPESSSLSGLRFGNSRTLPGLLGDCPAEKFSFAELVAADTEGREVPPPSSAATVLSRAIPRSARTLLSLDRRQPYESILAVLDYEPQLFDTLSDEQRESVRIMLLSRILARSTSPNRALDGRLLVAAWEALPRAIFPEGMDGAVRRLAKLKVVINGPSRIAQALLLADGKLNRALAEEHSGN